MIETLIEEAVSERRRGASEAEISSRFGPQYWQEAVRRFPSQPEMTAQRLFAKQNAERREFFRTNSAKTHRASQRDHDSIVNSIFDAINVGIKPDVRSILNAYASHHDRAPDWSERIVSHKHSGKMGKTLAAYKDHSVLIDLKRGGMLSQTHKSGLQNSTYSGLAELLFSGVQSVRRQKAMRERIATLEAELAKAKAATVSANARLKLKDQGQGWKEAAHSIRLDEPDISNRELGRRVGRTEAAIRKYLK